MTRTRLVGASVAAVASLGTVPTVAEAATITMSGSTSVAPLAAKLARAYAKKHHTRFRLAQGGSDIGIADVAAGRVSIGNSSRDPKPSDPGGLVFSKVARDGICLITNSSNHLGNLSQSQVQAIFSGSVVNWESVPGASAHGPIDLVTRNAASGTHDAFQKIFMGSTSVSTRAAQKSSNGLVQQGVKSDPQAIGYVSLAFTRGTNASAYQGVTCNLRNTKAETYQGVRNFWMVTRGKPRGSLGSWIHWVQSSGQANRIIASEWVPLH